jgi:hypothetical protein
MADFDGGEILFFLSLPPYCRSLPFGFRGVRLEKRANVNDRNHLLSSVGHCMKVRKEGEERRRRVAVKSQISSSESYHDEESGRLKIVLNRNTWKHTDMQATREER